jgi:ubiquinone/menaquinone biosynthesis C-methylase UbiE
MDVIPDWKLPPGVDRGLWDYLHNEAMVRAYDESLAGTSLLQADLGFCEHHFQTPGRLIDLGCGTGRLLVHFARKGFDCIGVDLSEAMLTIATENAKLEGLSISLLKANLVELDAIADASFDYAACLFSSLGMIRGADNRQRFLGHVARILKPEGTFVLHVHNRWFRFGRGLGKKGNERGDRVMPQAHGGAELTLHHFTRREATEALRAVYFDAFAVQPVGLDENGKLRFPGILSSIRAYGYLLAATRRC